MNSYSTKKTLSILLSGAMLASTFQPAFAAPMAAPAVPDFVRAFTPPSRLGYVDSFYKGSTEKPVILIEDLHANYGVQKNIEGMLKIFQPQATPVRGAMVVGVEGAWEDENLSFTRNHSLAEREKLGDFLMREAEMTGMEYFAMNSDKPVRLAGIDDKTDYLVNLNVIRQSAGIRLRLANRLDELHAVIAQSKRDAPRSLRKLWKVEEAFNRGDMDLSELARELGVSHIDNYGAAQSMLLKKKIELAGQAGSKAAFLTNLVKAEQGFRLLANLFRQQLTMEEVGYVAKQTPEILALVNDLMPGQDIGEWREALRSAIDHYAMAIVRDGPMAAKVMELSRQNPSVPVVMVFGGFHTAGVTNIFRQKNLSYVVISPVVRSHTMNDEVLYLRRILGDHLTGEEITAARTQAIHTAHTTAEPVEERLEGPVKETFEGGGGSGVNMPLRLAVPASQETYKSPVDYLNTVIEELKEASVVTGLKQNGLKLLQDAAASAGVTVQVLNESQLSDKIHPLLQVSWKNGNPDSKVLEVHRMPVDSTDSSGYATLPNLIWEKKRGLTQYELSFPVMYRNGGIGGQVHNSIAMALGAMGMSIHDVLYKAGVEAYLYGGDNKGIWRVAIRWDDSLPNGEKVSRRGGYLEVRLNPALLSMDRRALNMHVLKALINVANWREIEKMNHGEAEAFTMKEFVKTLARGGETAIPLTLRAAKFAADTLGTGFTPLSSLVETVMTIVGDRHGEDAVTALVADNRFEEAITEFCASVAETFDPNAKVSERGINMPALDMKTIAERLTNGVRPEEVNSLAAQLSGAAKTLESGTAEQVNALFTNASGSFHQALVAIGVVNEGRQLLEDRQIAAARLAQLAAA
jgi:hypothetical protein